MQRQKHRVIPTLSFFLILSIVIQFPVWVRADNGSDPAAFQAGLETAISREMAQNKIPGLSIAIFDENGVTYAKGFGVKDIATKAAVDENTLFVTASLSKTVAAYAALILVARGLMDLDEPLAHYLKEPYLPDAKAAAKITLRMILTHTSGLSNDASGKDRKVYSTPGVSFSYSSAGFRYLQQVVEDVTGAPFADFVAAEILEPLGMNASSFDYQNVTPSDMACGYYSGKTIDREPPRQIPVNASYSLIATPTDLAKFTLELCQPMLLDQDAVAAMIQPTVKWRPGIAWGLGIGILTRPGGNLLWHWGNNVTYQNFMLIDPGTKQGVIVMTNSSAGLPGAARLAVKVANDLFIRDGNFLSAATFDFLQDV